MLDLDGHEVAAVLSRVGKVAAAMSATLLVHEFGADHAIFLAPSRGCGLRKIKLPRCH